MKKNEKIVIAILILITLIVTIMYFVKTNKKEEVPENKVETEKKEEVIKEEYVDMLSDGTKLNKSNKLKKAKKVDGLEISNIQLTHRNGLTVLLADVKNNSGVRTELKQLEITLLDEDKKELTTIRGLIPALENGATTQLNTSVTSDYANIYDFEVTVK